MENIRNIYKHYGVDIDSAIKKLDNIKISIHCWQGDDVKGFLNFEDSGDTSGIQATGNFPGRASSAEELRNDLEKVLELVPGNHKVNLHAIYAETTEDIDLDQIEPKHFSNWVKWAKKHNIGLDFNPTCFSHPKASSGLTLSSNDENIRSFWVKHCKKARQIGKYFAEELNQKSVVNLWIPDGYKDYPIDRITPRKNLLKSLNEIYSEKIHHNLILDTVESKVFGIGLEGFTVGSHEFYLGYAIKNQIGLCLDAGHFHPTEEIADKLSSISLYVDEILLHVSRPMRWDSDHVVILDDQLQNITNSLVRDNLIEKTHVGLDFFDASINRIVAWVVGIRSTQKALLKSLLEPTELLKKIELEQDFSKRLALTEELKSLPFGLVYDYYCQINNVPKENEWYEYAKKYVEKIKRERK